MFRMNSLIPAGSGIALFTAIWVAPAVAQCDPTALRWEEVHGGIVSRPASTPPTVFALHNYDSGSGEHLYAGGGLFYLDVAPAGSDALVHRLVDGVWLETGDGGPFSDFVYCFATFDDGTDSLMYAGGDFDILLGTTSIPAWNIASWDGTSWNPVGDEDEQGVAVVVSGTQIPGLAEVHALLPHDDGSGEVLYVAGQFNEVGGDLAISASNIATWDGTDWAAVGSGRPGAVTALAEFDGDLYAGGAFGPGYVSKWDGSSWSAVGSGVGGTVWALAEFNGSLYAAGSFTSPGNRVARWNGTSWVSVGTGLNGAARTLTVFDDGTGPALYVGGFFTTAGGNSAPYIARWDGSAWSTVGGGTDDAVWALHGFQVDFPTAPAGLYVGGDFTEADSDPALHVARWGAASCYADCNCDGDLTIADYTCFLNAHSAEDPYADWNGDGMFTTADYDLFDAAFTAGCE